MSAPRRNASATMTSAGWRRCSASTSSRTPGAARRSGGRAPVGRRRPGPRLPVAHHLVSAPGPVRCGGLHPGRKPAPTASTSARRWDPPGRGRRDRGARALPRGRGSAGRRLRHPRRRTGRCSRMLLRVGVQAWTSSVMARAVSARTAAGRGAAGAK
jgi:hypothetical protein